MKLVILAAIVATTFAACVDFTATLPAGYVFGSTLEACTANAVVPGTAYDLAALNTEAGAGKAAGTVVTKLVCDSGYTKATTGIKLAATCGAAAALVGCTKTVAPKTPVDCAAKEIAAVAETYAAVSAPACAAGKNVMTACTKAKNTGAFWWTCTGNADGTTAGTWTKTGACAAAAWGAATNAQCPLAKKDVAASTFTAACSTKTAADCTSPATAPTFACPGGVATADPQCDTADLTAAVFCGASAKKDADATVTANRFGSTAVYKCTLSNAAGTTKGVTAAFKMVVAAPADATCGGGAAGSSAGTLSKFFAIVAAVAYMW